MSNTELKLGMIGLDTSHCEAFTKLLNDENNENHIPGAKITEAYPGGSSLFSLSMDRVEGITKNIKEAGVEIIDSISGMSKDLNGFLLESVDGRQHLEQFKILAEYGKPVFIDKPLACSYADAAKIVSIARDKKIPVMTASAVRFAGGMSELNLQNREILSCDVFGPMQLLDDYPGYFWYGIHSVDVLYSYMGEGCNELQVKSFDEFDVVIAKWQDGRICTIRGMRFKGGCFGCGIFSSEGAEFSTAKPSPPYYAFLLKKVIPFINTGNSSVKISESLEVIAFLEAMNKSRKHNGEIIKLNKIK